VRRLFLRLEFPRYHSRKAFKMTATWEDLPLGNVLAVCFHPEEFANSGVANLTRNFAHLRERLHPEVVTGCELTSRLTGDVRR